MSIYDAPVKTLHGAPASLADHKGEALLIVNVASKCGYTPQYTQLEELQKRYEGRGFSVLGFPSNQFGGQEPGTADEIEAFCALNYGVTFPIYEKIDVNGPNRNPLYAELTRTPTSTATVATSNGISRSSWCRLQGEVVARFRPKVLPDAEQVIEAIEAQLPR